MAWNDRDLPKFETGLLVKAEPGSEGFDVDLLLLQAVANEVAQPGSEVQRIVDGMTGLQVRLLRKRLADEGRRLGSVQKLLADTQRAIGTALSAQAEDDDR